MAFATRARRFGNPKSGLATALQRCLSSPEGRGEVVGVFAQLATVEDTQLSELMASAFSNAMQVG